MQLFCEQKIISLLLLFDASYLASTLLVSEPIYCLDCSILVFFSALTLLLFVSFAVKVAKMFMKKSESEDVLKKDFRNEYINILRDRKRKQILTKVGCRGVFFNEEEDKHFHAHFLDSIVRFNYTSGLSTWSE